MTVSRIQKFLWRFLQEISPIFSWPYTVPSSIHTFPTVQGVILQGLLQFSFGNSGFSQELFQRFLQDTMAVCSFFSNNFQGIGENFQKFMQGLSIVLFYFFRDLSRILSGWFSETFWKIISFQKILKNISKHFQKLQMFLYECLQGFIKIIYILKFFFSIFVPSTNFSKQLFGKSSRNSFGNSRSCSGKQFIQEKYSTVCFQVFMQRFVEMFPRISYYSSKDFYFISRKFYRITLKDSKKYIITIFAETQ